jgi:hypothetical protein
VGEKSSTEDVDSAIVSFAIPADESGDVKSLTLFRTPKYEFALDEYERGVKVSFEDSFHDRNELLKKLTIEGNMVTITTDNNRILCCHIVLFLQSMF